MPLWVGVIAALLFIVAQFFYMRSYIQSRVSNVTGGMGGGMNKGGVNHLNPHRNNIPSGGGSSMHGDQEGMAHGFSNFDQFENSGGGMNTGIDGIMRGMNSAPGVPKKTSKGSGSDGKKKNTKKRAKK